MDHASHQEPAKKCVMKIESKKKGRMLNINLLEGSECVRQSLK